MVSSMAQTVDLGMLRLPSTGLPLAGEFSMDLDLIVPDWLPELPKETKEKRKVGRPIAWVGDPNSPDLTPQERRRIKRRIANRESARRVRARRQDLLEDMIEKAKDIEAANAEMQRHAQECDEQCRALEAQAAEFHGRWRATVAENKRLQGELVKLRDALTVSQQAGAEGTAAELAPRAAAARAQSSALLDAVLPLEPMAVPLSCLMTAQAV
ncbi:hypothetical protein WJX81_008584 [Elliptochloris bilobata]|uniref:BZIP domain-containing protein n=1 Tax=Elliptochloris bilobata TaxID=381761 RepID=A0AAW1QYH3_9CHLO